jgi:hypothetical protein
MWREDLAHSIGIGIFGANSTANFVVQHSPTGIETGSFLSTGVSIDTSYHIFKMWSRGDGLIYAQVDNSAVVSATQTVAFVRGCMAAITVKNGTDAANRSTDVDWTFFAAGRS